MGNTARRLLITAATLAGGATIGVTAPRTTALKMQYVRGESIHLADQRGAINRHADVRIGVDLAPAGKLVATDHGTTRDHNLYETFSTDDVMVWTNTWSGTWTKRAGTLRLALVLDDRRCTNTRTMTGVAPKTSPCPAVSAKVALECSSDTVKIEDPARPRRVTRRAVWRCSLVGSESLAATPSTWVLGKRSCVQVIGGRGGGGHGDCTP